MTGELDRLEAAFLEADRRAQGGDQQAQQDARLFAQEIRKLQAQPDQGGGFAGAMNTVNEGIARGLGAPVDLVAGGLNMLGVGTGEAPLGGSESIRRGMNMVGAEPINRDPETMGERALMGAGEAAGALLPAGALARGLQQAGPVARGVGDAIMRPFSGSPTRAISAELAAGAGARVAGEYADQAADGRYGQIPRMAGELAGGLAAAAGPGALARGVGRTAEALPLTGAAIRGVKAAVAPFTEAGAAVRAQDRLQSLVANPQEAAARLQGESISDLTPAQRLNDPNLLGLERAASQSDPNLRDTLSARAADASETLSEELRAPANGGSLDQVRAFMERRRDTFRSSLTTRVEQAETRARERVQRLDPTRRESDNSVIVREELDRAYNVTKEQERALWARVPRSVEVPTVSARTAFNDIVAQTGQAQMSDIPADAQRLLGDGGFGPAETVQEMHALYSRLRQLGREARSGPAPNENKARISNLIADAILEDLGATSGDMTPAGRAINEARVFSREMNEVFNQGTVGMLNAQRRDGGPSVSPEATLSRSVGVGGVRGAIAVDDISRAAGPGVQPALEDFMRGRLMERADGRQGFNPNAAESFVRANRETLQRFPELTGDIGAAQAAAGRSDFQSERVASILAQLDNPRQNVGAAFLNANAGNEIAAAVFQTRNPARAAAALKREARRDQTGGALDGLKSGFLDYLTARAETGFDDEGRRLTSGNNMFGDLQDPAFRGAMAQIFDPQELSRMDRIAREFQGLQGAREASGVSDVIDDAPNSVISLLARTVAARQGARAGAGASGASLLTANFASRRMQSILERLTNDRAEALLRDAVQDRDLFVALMTRTQTPEAVRMVETRLTEWLIGSAGVAASELAQAD